MEQEHVLQAGQQTLASVAFLGVAATGNPVTITCALDPLKPNELIPQVMASFVG
jgi:hypothetical protein